MATARLARWLLATAAARAARGFVVMGVNNSEPANLPGGAYRWNMPTAAGDGDGLGQGLAYVLEPEFCERMLPKFHERYLVAGLSLGSGFVSCREIKAALLRGFATWEANHRVVRFTDLSRTAACAAPTGAISDPCPWELHVGTSAGLDYPKLAAYVINHRASTADVRWFERQVRSPSGVVATGVDAHFRSTLRFQTHLCWYLDATFCAYFHALEARGASVLLLVRSAVFFLFGAAALRLGTVLFWVAVAWSCTRRFDREMDISRFVRRRGGCSAACSASLDYLSTLSPMGNVLVLFCLIFPPIFYDRIFLPCWECYDFEAAAAHEVGHVLGFGHPDETAGVNLAARCTVTNATCRDPFGLCAAVEQYADAEHSIMHSRTAHSSATCLSSDDLAGLHFLYPLCDDLLPLSVSCTKQATLSGWLRLMIVAGVPFALASVLILVPLTCLRWRDQATLREVEDALGDAKEDIDVYRQELTVQRLRSAVRAAIGGSRPSTAFSRAPSGAGGSRPGSSVSRTSAAGALSRRGRGASGDGLPRLVMPWPAKGAGAEGTAEDAVRAARAGKRGSRREGRRDSGGSSARGRRAAEIQAVLDAQPRQRRMGDVVDAYSPRRSSAGARRGSEVARRSSASIEPAAEPAPLSARRAEPAAHDMLVVEEVEEVEEWSAQRGRAAPRTEPPEPVRRPRFAPEPEPEPARSGCFAALAHFGEEAEPPFEAPLEREAEADDPWLAQRARQAEAAEAEMRDRRAARRARLGLS